MEKYDFFNPIFYTEEQADDIAIAMHGVVVDGKQIRSIISNKSEFLKTLKEVVMYDGGEYYLSFKRVANGRISLHLHKDSGYVNLGKFNVDPALVAAFDKKDNKAFEHFALEEVSYLLHHALERVAKNEYKYDAKVADSYVRRRFDLRNFPEVEILSNVRLDRDTYEFFRNAHEQLKGVRNSKGKTLRDAFVTTCTRFDVCDDFSLTMDELYSDHVEKGEAQVAYFEPVYHYFEDYDVHGVILRKTVLFVSDEEVSPKTASSLFCIRTDDELARDYEDYLEAGIHSKIRSRFADMFVAISMALVEKFEKNCILVDGFAKELSSVH